jgi:hypothetical protein
MPPSLPTSWTSSSFKADLRAFPLGPEGMTRRSGELATCSTWGRWANFCVRFAEKKELVATDVWNCRSDASVAAR